MAVNNESLININSASKDELITISGIGEKLAQEIIDHRPFSKVEDLVSVSGISEAKLETLLPYVSVNKASLTKPRPKSPEPSPAATEKAPIIKLGDTEAFLFLEEPNERKDAILILLGGFIIGLIIILLRRRNK